jgi:hypothetical protein
MAIYDRDGIKHGYSITKCFRSFEGTCTNMISCEHLDSACSSPPYRKLNIVTRIHSTVEPYVHTNFQTPFTFPTKAGHTNACGQDLRTRPIFLIVLFSSMPDISSNISSI